MKITPFANSQYLDDCSVNNVQNYQPYFCAKKSKDEFVSDTKVNESFSERFIKKFLPGKAAELNLLKLIKLRNKNCPDDTLDERFAHEKLTSGQREQLQHLIYIPNRQKQLTKSELLKLVDNSYSYYRNERIYKKKDCTDNIIKYNLLYDIKNRREQFELDEIMKLGYEQPKTIEKILSLGLLENIKGRKVQPDMDDIITFAKALPDDNKEAQKVLKTIANRNLLTTDFGKGECLSLDKALVLAELDKKTYKEFLKKGLLKYHTNFSSDVLKRMLLYDFDDKQVSRFKKILQRDVFLYGTYANKVMALSDKQTELFLKVIDAGFQHKDSLAAFHVTTLDDDILEKFEKARSDAKSKKNLLKDGEHDLADEDIDDFFAENWDLICITIDTIGLPAFEYAYATKLEGLENLVRLNKVKFGGISDTFPSKLKKLLADKTISPDERLDKFRIIASLPDSGRSWLYPFIVPHRVTPENLSDAKAIWAQRGKTFDEKYLEFCEKFHISPDDTKIRKSIEKLANVNAKGYKLLYDIGAESMKEVIRKSDINQFNEMVYRLIFKSIDVEYDEVTAEKLNLAQSRYVGTVLYGSEEFKENFKEMVEIIKANPDKSLKQTFDELEQNISTRKQFKRLGIDYDKWCDVDKNSYVKVTIKTNADKARQAAVENLEKDLCDPDFQKLSKTETAKIFKALENEGFFYKSQEQPLYDEDVYITSTIEVRRLFKDGKRISFEDLPKVIKIIKQEINSNEYWFKDDTDAKNTVRNHLLKLRDTEIKEISQLKNDKETEIEVHKTDMNNISHSLFLGNQAGCCTGVASTYGNDYAAPRYIMDKCIQAIEVMDGGEFVGNTMCYIAKVSDKPALILDNIELTPSYQYNDNIRDAIFEYAKKLCTEIGKPDMPIYAGPYRHKVNLENFTFRTRWVQIVGDTAGSATYIDYCGEKVIDNSIGQVAAVPDRVQLFKIR